MQELLSKKCHAVWIRSVIKFQKIPQPLSHVHESAICFSSTSTTLFIIPAFFAISLFPSIKMQFFCIGSNFFICLPLNVIFLSVSHPFWHKALLSMCTCIIFMTRSIIPICPAATWISAVVKKREGKEIINSYLSMQKIFTSLLRIVIMYLSTPHPFSQISSFVMWTCITFWIALTISSFPDIATVSPTMESYLLQCFLLVCLFACLFYLLKQCSKAFRNLFRTHQSLRCACSTLSSLFLRYLFF